MTKIEWTDETWNPIVGCSVVSPGCTNCYAMRQAARVERMNHGLHVRQAPKPEDIPPSVYDGLTRDAKAGAVWTGEVRQAHDDVLTKPLRWKRPRRIFVNSMGDLFHESVPDAWIDRVFAVMALSPHHTFQVLTKRSKRMRKYCKEPETPVRVAEAAVLVANNAAQLGIFKARAQAMNAGVDIAAKPFVRWPLPNVWAGVSTEDQARADEHIPELLMTPAAVRFVSAEPLLGGIEMRRFLGDVWIERKSSGQPLGYRDATHYRGLDWIIVGGESGPGARPMHPDWARLIRDQCAAAGVPFFFKQWGEFAAHEIDRDGQLNPPIIDRFPPKNMHRFSDGRFIGVSPDENILDVFQGPSCVALCVGKSRAGRLLDGRTHDEYPEPRS